MSIESIREVTSRLSTASNALAVVAAALDARVSGAALDPAFAPFVDDVLDKLGLGAALAAVPPQELAPVLNEIRTWSLLNGKLLYAASRGPGWNHAEPPVLQTMGGNTHNLPMALKRIIAPALDGLAGRLESRDAAFLDVGAGVACLSIEMARAFPALRVVGVDPWPPAMALAHENVAKAGLTQRIELRQVGGEELSDQGAFDLAWVATPFIPEATIPALVERVHEALRPGGWMLFAIAKASPDPLADSLMRLRVRTFGGGQWTSANTESLLRQAGFIEVRTLPTPPGALAALVAARRAQP
jgi:precorrin-6B methylase 2